MFQVRGVQPQSDGGQDVHEAGDAPLQLQVRRPPGQPPRHLLQPSLPGLEELGVILWILVPAPTTRDEAVQTRSVRQFWDDCVNM